GALPGGVSFVDNGNGTATLSGTPAGGSGGIYPLNLSAINGVGAPGTQLFTLTVQQAPGFTSANAATFTVGNPNTFMVTTNGVPNAALVLSGGVLPSSVTFADNGNGTVTLSGTPAIGTNGTYPLSISAFNIAGSTIQSFTLTVNNPSTPIITSAASTTFTVGAPGSFRVTTAAFPVANVIGEIGGLPAGLTFVNNGDGTATLSGTPTAARGVAANHRLTTPPPNGGPATNHPSPPLIGGPAGGAPTITSANTTTFVVGTFGTFTVTTTGTPSATISPIGALPAGVNFIDNLDGTAT